MDGKEYIVGSDQIIVVTMSLPIYMIRYVIISPTAETGECSYILL